MLIRLGNDFGIAYATHIKNEGFKRFCIAHEIGHYRIPGHIDAVLAHGDIHESHAGFVEENTYEQEADQFAASLLMPSALFTEEMRLLEDGLKAVEALAGRCITSLSAAANRYIEKAEVSAAMVVSMGQQIDYCLMSSHLRAFKHLDWLRKGQLLPTDSETYEFNSEPQNIKTMRRAEAEIDLRSWFGGPHELLGREEVVGLGGFGKTLTILTSEIYADDEEHELEESSELTFRR